MCKVAAGGIKNLFCGLPISLAEMWKRKNWDNNENPMSCPSSPAPFGAQDIGYAYCPKNGRGSLKLSAVLWYLCLCVHAPAPSSLRKYFM